MTREGGPRPRTLAARAFVAVSALLVLVATSAPRPAMLPAPVTNGQTNDAGRATIVVTITGPALETTSSSRMEITATARDEGGRVKGEVKLRSSELPAASGFHARCEEMERDDEDPCVLVFDAVYEQPADLEIHVELVSNSTPGFPFSGNGSFEDGSEIRVEVR